MEGLSGRGGQRLREGAAMPVSSAPARRFTARSGAVLAALLLAALAPHAPLAAAGEYLVQDLGQHILPSTAFAFQLPALASLNGVAYFYFDDGVHGTELWRSDGTTLGTFLLADVCPGVCGSEDFYRFNLATLGPWVFFSGNDGAHGSELWRTDGTAPGTRLVADLRPGPSASEPSDFHAASGRLFFLADDGEHGRRVWTSDGSAAGTRPLFEPGADPLGTAVNSMTSGNGLLLLVAGNAPDARLWRSDGTLEGTFELHSHFGFPNGFGFQGAHRTLPSGILVFQGCAGSGQEMDCELWRSDGTVLGTYRIADLLAGSGSSSAGGFFPFGSEVWFSAVVADLPITRRGLFRTDGTPGGTVAIPLPPGTDARTPYSNAAPLGSSLVFVGCDEASGCEPWITDGTSAQRILDLRPGPDSSLGFSAAFDRPHLVSLGDRVLFLAEVDGPGPALWSTDGTPAGTLPVSDLGGLASASFGYYPALVPAVTASGRLVKIVASPDRGLEIWSSDGTAPGTSEIGHFENRSLGYLHPLHSLASPGRARCFAALRQGVVTPALTGVAPLPAANLFFSDGVPGGAVDLGPIDDGEGGARVECESNGSEVLASATLLGEDSIRRTTGSGLSPLLALGELRSRPAFERLGTRLLLVGTDPMSAGDPVLYSVPRGALEPGDVGQLPLTVPFGTLEAAGPDVYLGGSGALEVSDAETTSTVLIPLPEPPWDPEYGVGDLAAAGALLFFVRDTPEEGPELWISDGTPLGTGLVRELQVGPDGGFAELGFLERWNSPYERRVEPLAAGRVIFAGDDGVWGTELWTSDGTAEGTVLVADLDPGPGGGWPRHLTFLSDGLVLFAAEDPALGLELFRTDGTTMGTWMVRDLVPGPGSSVPDDFAVANGVLHFSAWTPAHGRELWRSDGTFAGTWRLTDIAPGPLSSSPSRFARAGNRLFFVATDHVHGFELWARADDGSVPLFIDGFETGDVARWSTQVP